ncbi:hypothetical protein BOTBODRAFT_176885 [Botryobasidium botryosum FD-172 SS1]|uniref:Uncharacterized protein n=1 Tax=Botryobasidium botryosum (strain FD-172 SS1) TaxID=930990 RepID=A0A067MB40_BOTB1|nr:hypothetical protein BOTBODRAFT_176885 [Botryobasidium botryosum FD-172 SS1]
MRNSRKEEPINKAMVLNAIVTDLGISASVVDHDKSRWLMSKESLRTALTSMFCVEFKNKMVRDWAINTKFVTVFHRRYYFEKEPSYHCLPPMHQLLGAMLGWIISAPRKVAVLAAFNANISRSDALTVGGLTRLPTNYV